jgi:hypothetical protein
VRFGLIIAVIVLPFKKRPREGRESIEIKKGMPAGMPFDDPIIGIYKSAWIPSSLALASGMNFSRPLIFSQP